VIASHSGLPAEAILAALDNNTGALSGQHIGSRRVITSALRDGLGAG
jgi:hypothetical protein